MCILNDGVRMWTDINFLDSSNSIKGWEHIDKLSD